MNPSNCMRGKGRLPNSPRKLGFEVGNPSWRLAMCSVLPFVLGHGQRHPSFRARRPDLDWIQDRFALETGIRICAGRRLPSIY
jgi:hypothetical protein